MQRIASKSTECLEKSCTLVHSSRSEPERRVARSKSFVEGDRTVPTYMLYLGFPFWGYLAARGTGRGTKMGRYT